SCDQAPKARVTERFEHLRKAEIFPRISFAGKGENGVWSKVHAAVDNACAMHAQERWLRIRNRINQAINEVSFCWLQFIILASERDDLCRGRCSLHSGNMIAV